MSNPTKAMIMGAGLGKRMRPLTNDMPKPLVKFNGKPLIDYTLSSLDKNGIRLAVVNVHYCADQMVNHLKGSQAPKVVISDERGELLETGGGAKKALSHFVGEPFLILNSDSIWNEENGESVRRLLDYWSPDKMDCLLLLANTDTSIGYDGKGDFFVSDDGRLTRRGGKDHAPYVFSGASIIKSDLFDNSPTGAFSLNILWNQAIENGTLFGVVHEDQQWLHIGTPEALKEAEEVVKVG